ncbi:MAG: hypothetical protein ACOH15_07310 [Acetobacterium sp.]
MAKLDNLLIMAQSIGHENDWKYLDDGKKKIMNENGIKYILSDEVSDEESLRIMGEIFSPSSIAFRNNKNNR